MLSAMTGSIAEAMIPKNASRLMSPVVSIDIKEAICWSFFSWASGSDCNVSKLMVTSKLLSGSPLERVWGSGTPVTLKNISSGPNRWKLR